ncbi:MAG: hypothetical protein ACTHLW_13285, partial [Verrucomicrobiota bacterium]
EAEIALDSGYYDQSAFARAYRSATNQTTSQFRASRSSYALSAEEDSWLSRNLRTSEELLSPILNAERGIGLV